MVPEAADPVFTPRSPNEAARETRPHRRTAWSGTTVKRATSVAASTALPTRLMMTGESMRLRSEGRARACRAASSDTLPAYAHSAESSARGLVMSRRGCAVAEPDVAELVHVVAEHRSLDGRHRRVHVSDHLAPRPDRLGDHDHRQRHRRQPRQALLDAGPRRNDEADEALVRERP